jgi:hypothetical protein
MLADKTYSWRAAKARLPPSRQVLTTIRSRKFLLVLAAITSVILLWRSMGSAAGEMQKYKSKTRRWTSLSC